MKTGISFRKCVISSLLLLFITDKVTSNFIIDIDCSRRGLSYYDDSDRPKLPEAFSTNIRANFVYKGSNPGSTTEIKYVVNKKEGRELIELKSSERRVQYIFRKDLEATLKITFNEDGYPVCDVDKTSSHKEFIESMDSKDIGPNGILQKTILVLQDLSKFYPGGPDTRDGMFARRWVQCSDDPKINVSLSFAVPLWDQAYTSVAAVNYTARGEAQIFEDTFMTALFSNVDPSTPDNKVFQPPQDVYCKGLKNKNDFPSIGDFFSYNAEIVTYVSVDGIAPIISHRQVYYDYKAGLSRVDFYDAFAKDTDMFASIIAQKKSIIHDFKSGTQYSYDFLRGKCTLDTFESTFSVISSVETENNKMLNGKEFFWLDKAEISYNGQFLVRGVLADVYTAVKVDPQTKKNFVVSWYFSSRETRVVQDVNVEKNVLLRMSIRPEIGFGKQGVIVINFYDFLNDEPGIASYDITRCYNETSSKLLVLTFPGNPLLRGSENLVGVMTHLAIKKILEVRSTRIFVREVALNEKYLFVEFYLLEAPPNSTEISLDKAVETIQTAMLDKKIIIEVAVDKNVIKLQPEPDGLNVFAGDRIRTPSVIGYKEGSVISMAFGMLILGILLGGVTLNLIMSKKFGVSLFQKAKYGSGPFNDNHESSM